MNLISQYKGLNRNFYIMTFAVLVNCAGSFVSVFLSLYLTVMLGLNAVHTGIIVSIYTLLHIPGSLIGGRLSDVRGRKITMVVSQLLMGACFIAVGFTLHMKSSIILLCLANFCDGITDPARSALEIDMTTAKDRQIAFSLLYQAFNIGFAIGPMAAGWLFYSHPQWLFWGNGLALMISISIVMIFVPESKPDVLTNETNISEGESRTDGSVLKALLSRPQLLLFSIGTLLIAFAYKQISFVLPIQLNEMFNADGPRIYGTIASLNAFSVILLNPIVLNISKRNNVLKNVIYAVLTYAVSFLLLGIADLPYQFFIITIFYTIGEMLINNNSRTYQSNNTPVNFRGRFNAILPLFKTVGVMSAPIIGGLIVNTYSFPLLWTLVSIIALATCCIYLYVYKHYEIRREN